jgi:hypothetical protein
MFLVQDPPAGKETPGSLWPPAALTLARPSPAAFRVFGMGFWVSGFGFRVSGLGCGVWGL